MAEHRTHAVADQPKDDWADPGYSALPPEGSTCICGQDAHAVVVVQTGVERCDSCGTEKVQTAEFHLCDTHNDLRMQGKLDGAKLLLASRLHSNGGMKGMSAAEREQTVQLVLGLADPESATRVWASDQSGVRLLERTESEKLTRDMQRTLRGAPAEEK
jgi:hypothetical protein